MQLCPEIKYRIPRPYVKTLGSGWFWCHRKDGWMVCYINALWGACVDGRYISTSNFDDVEGPLSEPSVRAAVQSREGDTDE